MPKPISNEKRADIIKHMQAGESKEDIAKWLLITVKTVKRVWKRYQSTGSYEAMPNGGGRKPLVDDETMNRVVSKIKEVPDITLLELIEEFNLPFTESALCRRLIKRDLTFKKRHSIRMGENVKMS
jgi:transposase